MSEKKKNGKKPEVASGISMVSKEKFESHCEVSEKKLVSHLYHYEFQCLRHMD